MRWSNLLIPTLKEDPAEAEAVSHKLSIRAGLIRQLAAGIYIYLPLGWRIMEKIHSIIREEMEAIGGQEFFLPVLHPAEVWQQTGRWYEIGQEMFRLKDRGNRDLALGMTHEEIVAWLAAREIRSYRDLPQVWYQIQTKMRDEARPKSGVLRTREFIMKDSYSFDRDEQGLEESYQHHLEAYRRIFSRCGLEFYVVESDPGMMGGAGAHEFMAPSEAGEDEIALCPACGYAANIELATSRVRQPEFQESPLQEVATPEARTIEEVSAFLRLDPRLLIKSILVVTQRGPLLAMVRGDQQIHPSKLARVVGEFRPAHRDEVLEWAGVEAGFLGPTHPNLPKIADLCLREGIYVAGANKAGFHLKGVIPGTHFQADFADIRSAQRGDLCSKCSAELDFRRCIEVGNIFKLGTKYSEPLKAYYLDESGKERPIIMGSYGIGPARIAAAAIEQSHDEAGIIWPPSIAPFQVLILPVNVREEAMRAMAEDLYRELRGEGIETLLDDRDERPGSKFKDADLVGIPLRITVGPRAMREGVIEIRQRQTGEEFKLPRQGVLKKIRELLDAKGSRG
ncbi:MAG: proline--tRNA ligase [candidate division NC10 bacterium]|nr:proline--tRNA ligase [candidate division NC10 bacterium]